MMGCFSGCHEENKFADRFLAAKGDDERRMLVARKYISKNRGRISPGIRLWKSRKAVGGVGTLESLMRNMCVAEGGEDGGDDDGGVEAHARKLQALKKDLIKGEVKKGVERAMLRYPRVCKHRCEFVDVLAEHCRDEVVLEGLLDSVLSAEEDVQSNLWDAVVQAVLYENDQMLNVLARRYAIALREEVMKERAVEYLGKWGTNKAVIERVMRVIDLKEKEWLRRLSNAAFVNMNTELVAYLIKERRFRLEN